MCPGCVVWLTGLPSAGKSTLARLLETELRGRGRRVECLDGDAVRLRLTKGLGFSREDRDENVRRVAFVAQLLARNEVIAIAALISPYRVAREEVRAEIGRFIEVYVKCDVAECIRRDVKGLYRRALAGEIKEFTGISDPYEPPLAPEVVVETDREAPEESVGKILDAMASRGYLGPAEERAVRRAGEVHPDGRSGKQLTRDVRSTQAGRDGGVGNGGLDGSPVADAQGVQWAGPAPGDPP